MTVTTKLPEGYRAAETLDLQKNRKQMLIVNGLAFLIFAIMYIPVSVRFPLNAWMEQFSRKEIIWLSVIMLAGVVLYLVGHELTHGIVMKLRGGSEVKYGFTGLYAFAGSEADYFDKTSYIMIALAPVVVWGILFTVLLVLFPKWFWLIYFWQMINVGGAAGDFYVTGKTIRMPETVLVKDTGVSMTFFTEPATVQERQESA